jgi:hypothetical protein
LERRSDFPTYAGTRQFLWVLGTVLLAVMAILVGLAIASTVSMSVPERSWELGPLRSVGFTARWLLGLLVRETLLLAGFAGAGGLMAGSLLALLLSSLGIRFRLPGLASGMLLRIAVTPEVLPLSRNSVRSLGPTPSARCAPCRMSDPSIMKAGCPQSRRPFSLPHDPQSGVENAVESTLGIN